MWLGTAAKTLYWASLTLCGSVLLHMTEGDRRKATEGRRKIDLQSLLHSLPEPVFLFDDQGRITGINRPAEQLAGVCGTELLGTDGSRLYYRVADQQRDGPQQLPLAKALGGEFVRHERGFFRAGTRGQEIEVLVSASPIHGVAARIVGALVVVQDVTELSELQRQMASSERHFAVGQMTAGLAHDFNNVLTAISQAVYVMDTEAGRSDRDHTMLRIIQNSVRRGAEIVGNIRGYLRGGREERTRVNVRLLLEEVLQLARPLLEMHGNIRVTSALEDSCEVKANAPELRRVFTNLILNAVDAMPEGGTLSMSCVRKEAQVLIRVQDSGAGIPLETQKMIFSPYFTTKPQGTGLGLAGARRTIQSQGGDIRFESSPGTGTTFIITLPIANGGAHPNIQAA